MSSDYQARPHLLPGLRRQEPRRKSPERQHITLVVQTMRDAFRNINLDFVLSMLRDPARE